MYTAFHPQTEAVNRILGDMLRCLVQTVSNSELVLSQAKFPYNNLVNRSTGLSPFQICRGYDAPTALDLAPLPPQTPARASVMEFAQHRIGIHEEVHEQL